MSVQLPPPGTWVIEPSHSTIDGIVRHLRVTKVRGSFSAYEGTVTVAEDPLDSTVQITIDASTIDTGNDDRDAHLRSGDFLDVENYPTLQFVSSEIRGEGDSYELLGQFTMAGVSRPVTLDVTYGGLVEDPWGNQRALFAAETTLDREEWGLTWNQALEAGGVLVSKDVRIEIELQLLQQ